MELTGQQRKQLRLALQKAFPDRDQLARMVDEELSTELSLNEVTNRGNLESDTYYLIQWAQAHGLVMELVLAARQANPTNPALERFAESIAPPSKQEGELERIVLKHLRLHDLHAWMEQLTARSKAVARIEYQGQAVGTGFLIAPDRLLTNRHVVDEIERAAGLSAAAGHGTERVAIRFDALTDQAGEVGSLVSSRPLFESPAQDLDFAILQLAIHRNDGTSIPGSSRHPIELASPQIEPGDPLLILQHPEGMPLKLAIGMARDIDCDRGCITYTTNTNPGSSGSPCLTADLELAALHSRGASDANTGILASAIADRLTQ